MNGKDAVRMAMKDTGMTSPMLAKQLGYNTPSGVTERLRGSQDMRVDTFAKFLNAMGYEIVVKKVGETDGVVLTGEAEEGKA